MCYITGKDSGRRQAWGKPNGTLSNEITGSAKGNLSGTQKAITTLESLRQGSSIYTTDRGADERILTVVVTKGKIKQVTGVSH